jgi:hypothetical protein
MDLSTFVPLFDAPRLFPKDRRGRHPHISCVYRWSKYGKHGIVLESWLVGRCRCTTPEAIARFVERLSKAAELNGPQLANGRAEAEAALARLNATVFHRARKAGE